MEPFSKPCKTSDPPAYTATDKTAQYLQPFFPSCLTKYPNALKFFRETSDLYCIVAKPQTCTCHPTVCYRYTTERPLEKYYFTDLKYGKRTLSRSELCKTWLVSLDFLSLIEYRLLQQVEKSVDKDGNQQSDVYNLIHKKNVETYQNWRPIAEGLTIAMDKLYSWEISHHLPNHWTPYDATQSNGGQIALENFVLTHIPAQAQTQDTSSMAPGQYHDYQKPQKLRDSQLSSDNNNNNTNINKNDTLTLSIITTTKRVLSVFDNNPDNFFVWYKKENVDQLPSRQVNGFNSYAEPL